MLRQLKKTLILALEKNGIFILNNNKLMTIK